MGTPDILRLLSSRRAARLALVALPFVVLASVAGTVLSDAFPGGTAVVLAALLGPAPAPGAADKSNWHAPSRGGVAGDLDGVLGGEGVWGFIYDTSRTPDGSYGTYNWCNMPHVRKEEYVKPAEEFVLQYVEVIHRHHKRTPYAANAFPVESYQWNCDGQGLYSYGEPLQGPPSAARVYRQGVTGDVNPFVPSGWVGSCQFPQITEGGLEDSYQHGSDLYGVYGEMLGFLPGRGGGGGGPGEGVRYRVTNNVITHQVAGMVISGMWHTNDRVPVHVQAVNVDSLEPQYSCPRGSELFDSIQSSSNSAWYAHLTETRDLYALLDDISGVPADDEGFHVSFDHYYDNLSARQCHDKPLPCKIVNGLNSTQCVTQETADAVYRLGHWEYSQIYRGHPASLEASLTSYGVWIAELASHLRAAMAGSSDVVYFHNVAHDGSVSRLLSILQIDEMVWPGMGSEVVFELYKKGDKISDPKEPGNEHYIRVLFSGRVLKSSNPRLGAIDLIPVTTLLEYFDELVGENASAVKSKCQSSSARTL